MTNLAKLRSLLNWKWGALIAALLAISAVSVASSEPESSSGRTPKPTIEAGKGEKCVEDTDYMRRNHMKLLMHQRDDTMHKGIRTKKYSLQNCIECHASKKNNSVLGSNENFCQSCHSYAAVKIDCFECHATKPKATVNAAGFFHPIIPPSSEGDVKVNDSHGLSFSMRQQMRGSVVDKNIAGASK